MKKNTIAKRVGALVLCGSLTAGALMVAAGAASTNVTAQISPNISVVVDGAYQTFYNAAGQEVQPITYNGTTYLPIRAVGELMGRNVNWDQANMAVSLSGKRTTGTVSGTPDNSAKAQNVTASVSTDITVLVDGTRRSFTDANGKTVYPLVYNGSIYLPLRAIGNLMGKNVSWDGTTSTVTLSGDLLVTDADSFNSTGNSGTNAGQSTSTGIITAETAKSKALADAGLTASQVTFVRTNLEWDDGRQVYDVEFYTADYKEYDYEIDAVSGKVLDMDYDAEHYQRPSTGSSDSYISKDKAISIALGYVSGAGTGDVRTAKLDYDDGRAEYEVKIIYNSMEYEFEIDAVTGKVLSWDKDSIYD